MTITGTSSWTVEDFSLLYVALQVGADPLRYLIPGPTIQCNLEHPPVLLIPWSHTSHEPIIVHPFDEDHASKYCDPLARRPLPPAPPATRGPTSTVIDRLVRVLVPVLSSCVICILFLPFFFPPLVENCTLGAFFPLLSRRPSLLNRYPHTLLPFRLITRDGLHPPGVGSVLACGPCNRGRASISSS